MTRIFATLCLIEGKKVHDLTEIIFKKRFDRLKGIPRIAFSVWLVKIIPQLCYYGATINQIQPLSFQ